MSKIPIIIDTDPGIDDAMMLTFAFANNHVLDIRLVTTSSGNISQGKSNHNARVFLSYIGANVEVARGLESPFLRELELAEDIHGENGFGNVQFLTPPLPVSHRPAVTAMLETILNSNEKITIAATGPLTNVAALLVAHPEVKTKIERVTWMGGAAVGGNVTPTAEFNAYVDPHAVQIVFNSGIPVVMSGLDVTHKAYITKEEIKKLQEFGTEFTQKLHQMVTFYLDQIEKTPFHAENYDQVVHFHDVVPLMYLLQPHLFEGTDHYVEVELEGKAVGATVVDYYNRTKKEPNVHVLHNVEREKFVEEFMKAVENISERLTKF